MKKVHPTERESKTSMTRTSPIKTVNRQALLLLAIGLLTLVGASAALPPGFGGTFTLLVSEPFDTLDPAFATTTGERHAAALIAEPLVKSDGRNALPCLAERWEMENDGRRWRVWLKTGLVFHDGSPCRAADVAASLNRIRKAELGSPITPALVHLDRIEVVSPYELLFELNARRSDFIHRLANPALAVLPERLAASTTPILQPIGTGPFSLTTFAPSRSTLDAFPAYHGGRAFLDRLVFETVDTKEAEKAALDARQASAVLGGRLDSGEHTRRQIGLSPSRILLRPNPSIPPNVARRWAELLTSLVACETTVRLFETRPRAPFPSEKAPALQFAPGPSLHEKGQTNLKAMAAAFRQAIGHSCAAFKPDPILAAKRAAQFESDDPFLILVRRNQPELVLMAERIALATERVGLPVNVLALSVAELARLRTQSHWQIELAESGFNPTESADPSGTVEFYRLAPAVDWVDPAFNPTPFDAFGLLQVADIYRRKL